MKRKFSHTTTLGGALLFLGVSARHLQSAEGETTFGKQLFQRRNKRATDSVAIRSRAAMRAVIPYSPPA